MARDRVDQHGDREIVMKIAGLLLGVCSVSVAATLRVPGDYATIQGALDATRAGDTVVVAPGEYVIADPVTFQGKSVTLRSEAGPDRTVVRMAPGPQEASVVIFDSGETAESVLEGFTLTGGRGLPGGGGITCTDGSAPTVVNCTIAGNHGPGIRILVDSSPAITNCRFSGNDGRGVLCDYSSSPALTDCTISGNDGGVSCGHNSTPVFTSCAITENRTSFGGGIWTSGGGSPTLLECTITANVAVGGDDFLLDGGGVMSVKDSSAKLINCLIAGNTARMAGGGAACESGGSVEFSGCTIAENRAGADGGGLFSAGGSLRALNSIVWGNLGGSIMVLDAWPPDLTYSCAEGDAVWHGEANINRDPLFCLPGEWDDGGTPDDLTDDVWVRGDYRLSRDSPCLGTGQDGANMGADLGECEPGAPRFRRGDVNTDADLNVADAVYILQFLFVNGPRLSCPDAADANDDGDVNIADAVAILAYLFAEAEPLPAPLKRCGPDPTDDTLDPCTYPEDQC
ncbi:MAG: right-handed parallel beta-helix repeat-containing protein [Phycisphaerales bacterium]|nr:MAG: right-handed parallel beta-helix repeat-containing protein [Phycisphaerales bacterium]